MANPKQSLITFLRGYQQKRPSYLTSITLDKQDSTLLQGLVKPVCDTEWEADGDPILPGVMTEHSSEHACASTDAEHVGTRLDIDPKIAACCGVRIGQH